MKSVYILLVVFFQGVLIHAEVDNLEQSYINSKEAIEDVLIPRPNYSMELVTKRPFPKEVLKLLKLNNMNKSKLLDDKKLIVDAKIKELIANNDILIIYNSEIAYFTIELEKNTYNVIYKTSEKDLLEKIDKLYEQKDKNFITVCKEVLTWISLIKDGVEVGCWATKKICELVEAPVSSGTGNPAGSGTTWHHGQGGDSIYDVNKFFKDWSK